MIKIIPLFFALLTAPVFGQAFEWVNIGIGNDKIEGKKLLKTNNGDLIAAGCFEGSGVFSDTDIIAVGEEDFFITRYDSAGNHLWSRAYGGFDNDKMKDLANGPNNTIYVCGSTDGAMILDTLIFENINGTNGFIAQFDEVGNIRWGLNLESNSEISANAMAISESDSIAYIAGQFKDSAYIGMYSVSSFASESFFVAAVDYFGNVLWISTGASQDEVEPVSIVLSENSKIHLLGNFEGNLLIGSNVLPNTSDSDAFLLCIDESGDFIWSKSIGGTDDIKGRGITTDVLGNIFIVGSFEDQAHFNTDTLNSLDDEDGFFAKYSEEGIELWAKAFNGSSEVKPKDIFKDHLNGLYITGSIDGTCYFDSLVVPNTSGTDLFIVKYDTSGNALWAKGVGGSGGIEGCSIITDDTGNPIVTGYFEGTAFFDEISVNGFSDHDFFIAKLVYSADTASIAENFIGQGQLVLFPNPANDKIYLKGGSFNTTIQFEFELRDAQGRMIKNLFWKPNKPIDIGFLNTGLYFLNVGNTVLQFYKE